MDENEIPVLVPLHQINSLCRVPNMAVTKLIIDVLIINLMLRKEDI